MIGRTMNHRFTAALAGVALLASSLAQADDLGGKPVTIKIPGVEADRVLTTPVAGVYEAQQGANIVYVTADGKFVFTGDLYRVAGQSNMTDLHRRDLRRALIEAMPESDMLVFSPPNPKYTITVFTDVDCGYCRALHRQIADYNKLGIKVRYLSFPRTGPNTPSWFKAEQVWCSDDRNAALTRAKLDQSIPGKVCANNPVAREYALGKAIGLDGTPGVVAANGDMVGGYLPPADMLTALEQLKN